MFIYLHYVISITRVAILKTSFYHTKIACSFIDAAYLKYKTFELRKLHIWHLLLSSLGINCLLQRVFEVVESNKWKRIDVSNFFIFWDATSKVNLELNKHRKEYELTLKKKCINIKELLLKNYHLLTITMSANSHGYELHKTKHQTSMQKQHLLIYLLWQMTKH